MYPADGRKLPDIHTHPAELRDELQGALGQFPLFRFWGPAADITSTRWIGKSALHVFGKYKPTLTLVYLPHLDYNLQRLGPVHPAIAQEVAQVDEVCGELIDTAQSAGAHVVALSEYGITDVSRPVHINRALRQAGWLRVREELGASNLMPGRPTLRGRDTRSRMSTWRPVIGGQGANLSRVPGVDVSGRGRQARIGLDHPRSGELVAIARPDSWFTTTTSWTMQRAGLARTVDIHRNRVTTRWSYHRSGAAACQAAHRAATGTEEARHALSDGRDSLVTRSFARPPDRSRWGRCHHSAALAKDGPPRAGRGPAVHSSSAVLCRRRTGGSRRQ